MREEESGLTRWEFLVESAANPEVLPMNVVSQGFTMAEETAK